MKNKIFKSVIVVGIGSIILMISSCNKTIDAAYQNPNAAVVEPIESILSGVIGSFTYFYSSAGTGFGVVADGLDIGRYVQYYGLYSTSTLDFYGEMGGTPAASDATGGLWGAVYYGQGQNVNRIIEWGAQQQKWDYVGVGWAIRAWGWLELVDAYGDAILRQAFNTSLQQFKYDVQSEFYDSCRAICFRSIAYLNRTDGNVSQSNLAIGDAYFYNGDRSKWIKFVYGILARSYQNLSSKAIYTTNGYADSAIKYANLSLATNADNAYVTVSGGLLSATNNYLGPFRGNIGTLRQSSYIASLMTGLNTTTFTGVTDPRVGYMLRENLNGTYKGCSPWLAANGLSANDHPENFWGNTASGTSTAAPTVDNSRYVFQNTAPFPMMTASEMQFIIAEAAYFKKNYTLALSAYTNAISLNIDMLTTTYPQNILPAMVITPTVKSAYLANPAVVPTVASSLTLSQIMMQKYISMYGYGLHETWVDMRKYHYTDLDPVTGKQVYGDFTPPSGIYLYSTNNGKLTYRFKPRYNSEYLYDIPELTRIGAMALDYNTNECWFSQK